MALTGLIAYSLALASLAEATHVSRRQDTTFRSEGNPILADGSIYSADPAPLVVNGTVYILCGRDEAGTTENTFVIDEWQVLSAQDPSPSGGDWVFHSSIAQPQDIFAWATAGSSFASQIVEGADGSFYLYAPVEQRDAGGAADAFGIGVAVADEPLGPFVDVHPAGPIISQTVPSPGNSIHNIDPTVLVDDDGRVFIYWGSFGQLMGYELEADMITTVGLPTSVSSLTGYFEAPWIMKRKGTYYMLYAGNNAGPDSACTPTSYHACIAYGTATDPLGPWTYRGVVLDIVSSTTSHPGVFQLGEQWFLTYHTRDAVNGTHFRRSVAFDELQWDDSTSPPLILKVEQTRAEQPPPGPSRNIAPRAVPSSDHETPIQYWISSLNDGRVETNPLPPDYWSSYAAEDSPENSILTYTWNETVQLNGVSVAFFADQPKGSKIGVPPPASWSVEYQDAAGEWRAVSVISPGGYPTIATDSPAEVTFEIIATTTLRAMLSASGADSQFGGIGIKEWVANSPEATA